MAIAEAYVPNYDAAAHGAGGKGTGTAYARSTPSYEAIRRAIERAMAEEGDERDLGVSPVMSAAEMLSVAGGGAGVDPFASGPSIARSASLPMDLDLGFNPTGLPLWPGSASLRSTASVLRPAPRRTAIPGVADPLDAGDGAAGATGAPDADAGLGAVTAAFGNPTGLGRSPIGAGFSFGPFAGLGFNAGPFGLSLSPLGGARATLGPVGVGLAPTGQASASFRGTGNATVDMALAIAAQLARMPTALQLGTLTSMLSVAPLAGPAALVLGSAFPAAVQLAEAAAKAFGVTTNAVDIARAAAAAQDEGLAFAGRGSHSEALSSALANAMSTIARGGEVSQATLDATPGLQAALSAAFGKFTGSGGSPSAGPGLHASDTGFVAPNTVSFTVDDEGNIVSAIPVGAATGNAPPGSTNFGEGPGNTSGGAAPGTSGAGAGTGGVTGSDAVDSGVAGSSPSSGGAGDGGASGGTVLVTWLHRRGHKGVSSKVKLDAIRLRQNFLKAHPKTGPAALRKYVVVSTAVTKAVDKLPRERQAAYEDRIYRAMVGPNGKLDTTDFIGAVGRLKTLLKALSDELGVKVAPHHFDYDPRSERSAA